MKWTLFVDEEDKMSNRSLAHPLSLATRRLWVPLGLTFGLLFALLVAVEYLGISRMNRINFELQEMMGESWSKLRLGREAVARSNRNSRITMEILVARDRELIAPLLLTRAENTERITALLADLKKLCAPGKEMQLLGVVDETRHNYVNSYLQSLHLQVAERKPDAAAILMLQQTTPALLKYQGAWDNFEQFEGNELELAIRESRIRYSTARHFALFVFVVAVALGGAISILALRRIVMDMTLGLRSEKETLRAAHQRAEFFIDAVPSILIGLNHELCIVRWNSTAARVFELSEEEVTGKQLANCGVRWLRDGLQDEIRSLCAEQTSRRCDYPFEIKGKTRLLGLTVTPVSMDDKTFIILLIGSDITDRRTLEERLRQAEKLESVGQLAAGIAHEINTPMQYIGDNVRFLKDAFLDVKSVATAYERLLLAARDNTLSQETVQEVGDVVAGVDAGYLFGEIPKAIDQTLEGVTRVSTLVSAMKEFSHPDTKEKIPLDLNHAIDSTITVARNEWKYVANMKTDFDPSLPPVLCQPGEFNQVILNLIVNAAHAIADGLQKTSSEIGTIGVQTRNCLGWAEIRIQDTGSGIPENVRSRIFDPFFTTKEIGKGTGQGLAIAHSAIVDKHGGSIHFETKEGEGTTFIIRLPYDGKALPAKAVTA